MAHGGDWCHIRSMSNVLVVGASRGIGYEFVRQYRNDGHDVTATVRDSAGLARVRGLGAHAFMLDVTDADCASILMAHLQGRTFDVALVCAGVGSRLDALDPPTASEFELVMRTNVLGPMRALKPIADALSPGAKLALLSSQMGSIESRHESSRWLYRASKAALNSIVKDTSLALGGRAICISIHPGWVRTDMGGVNADISVLDSVAGMRKVIAALDAEDTGTFRDHKGASIAW